MVYIFTLLWFRNMICILFIFICFLMIVRYQVVSFENLVVQGVLMFILFSLQESVGALLQNLNIWFKRLLRGVVFFCWMQKQLGEQIQLIDIFIRFFLDTFINFRLLILEMVDFFWVLFVYVYIIYYILVYVKNYYFICFFFICFLLIVGKFRIEQKIYMYNYNCVGVNIVLGFYSVNFIILVNIFINQILNLFLSCLNLSLFFFFYLISSKLEMFICNIYLYYQR